MGGSGGFNHRRIGSVNSPSHFNYARVYSSFGGDSSVNLFPIRIIIASSSQSKERFGFSPINMLFFAEPINANISKVITIQY